MRKTRRRAPKQGVQERDLKPWGAIFRCSGNACLLGWREKRPKEPERGAPFSGFEFEGTPTRNLWPEIVEEESVLHNFTYLKQGFMRDPHCCRRATPISRPPPPCMCSRSPISSDASTLWWSREQLDRNAQEFYEAQSAAASSSSSPSARTTKATAATAAAASKNRSAAFVLRRRPPGKAAPGAAAAAAARGYADPSVSVVTLRWRGELEVV